jgi:hypothetical protein
MLNRDQILQMAKALRREEVDVPEWGGKVIIQEPSGADRDDYEQSLLEARKVGRRTEIKPNFANARARLVVKCVVNEDGARIFKDSDADELGRVSGAVLARLVNVIKRLGAMDEKDVEDLEGN